jgi:hypothetical protein
MRPPNTAFGVACVGLLMGVQQLSHGPDGPMALGQWAGVALALAMLAASLRLKRGIMLGIGAAGVVLFALQLVTTVFEGAIAGPIGLLVAGVLFIGLAVFVAIALPRMRGSSSKAAVT